MLMQITHASIKSDLVFHYHDMFEIYFNIIASAVTHYSMQPVNFNLLLSPDDGNVKFL